MTLHDEVGQSKMQVMVTKVVRRLKKSRVNFSNQNKWKQNSPFTFTSNIRSTTGSGHQSCFLRDSEVQVISLSDQKPARILLSLLLLEDGVHIDILNT